ncbi:MAG: low affinity iron permease family protein [Taibaiella sp.]|nr:low affinity iron permease family protein [Taibaiella sp.]
MKKKSKSSLRAHFDRFAGTVTRVTGTPATFMVALAIIITWGITGPLFGFSDTWQLVINTGTTIITFLMVFVIQQAQNKESMAMQLKLNELIAATKGASNRLVDIEDLTDEELLVLKKFYVKLSRLSEQHTDLGATHSIDEAVKNSVGKRRGRLQNPDAPMENKE